jgi:hypothetical protein
LPIKRKSFAAQLKGFFSIYSNIRVQKCLYHTLG